MERHDNNNSEPTWYDYNIPHNEQDSSLQEVIIDPITYDILTKDSCIPIDENASGSECMSSDSGKIIPSSWSPPYNTECPCCLEIPEQGRVILSCKHLLCINCFKSHTRRNNTCPICRDPIIKPDISESTSSPNNINAFPVLAPVNAHDIVHDIVPDIVPDINNVRFVNYVERQIRRNEPILRRPPTRNRETRQLRNQPPLMSSVDEVYQPTNECTYKVLSVLVITDIFIMACWMYILNYNR